MKTPVSSPATSALVLSIANGDSHESSGSMEPGGASPAATFQSATPANSSSAPTCAPISQF